MVTLKDLIKKIETTNEVLKMGNTGTEVSLEIIVENHEFYSFKTKKEMMAKLKYEYQDYFYKSLLDSEYELNQVNEIEVVDWFGKKNTHEIEVFIGYVNV